MTEQQAPWLLPCGCVRATVLTPLDHRGDCPTLVFSDPTTLDLSAAANWVLLIDQDPNLGASHKVAARMVWEALTGLGGADALAYAHRITDRSTYDHRLIAVIPPF